MRLARLLPILLAFAGPAPAVAADAAPANAPLTIFAAASLTDALNRIDALWVSAGHPAVRASFGSSGALARQIGAGAPADVFLSADEKWMDALAGKGLLAPGTRTDLLGNALVLVEPASSVAPVAIKPGFDLAALLGPGGRLSVGNTASVPAGIYAAQALHRLGVWNQVSDRLAPATDVRAALLQVANGATRVGIVYRSDVHGVSAVGVAGIFPPDSHVPIVYPGAALKAGHVDEAKAYLVFLATPPVQAIFRAEGFNAPPDVQP